MHTKNKNEVFKMLQTSEMGLTQKEANLRIQKFGKNELEKKKKQSRWLMFFGQFSDVMIIVLCVAALISGVIGFATKSSSELFDALIVLLIVFLNAIIGFAQEVRAQKSMDFLKKSTVHHSVVLRDGEKTKIMSSDLTVGDVVVLEAGDLVSADLRIIQAYNLKINEAILTGESLATTKKDVVLEKDVPVGDRCNMAYSGGIVETGRGMGVVCSVGMQTGLGKIASALNEAKQEPTLLQKKLNKTAKIITNVCLVISLLIFVLSLCLKMGLLPAFMTSVAIAVAAIPEGLPAIITIIMALSISRLARQKAIVKKLRAVETLGCTQVICVDKTGTITLNKLTVEDQFYFDANLTQKCAYRCNNASIAKKPVGDSMEIALLEYLKKENVNFCDAEKIDEMPFDSSRKCMSVVFQEQNGKFVFCKGAPDVVLNNCTHVCKNGEVVELSEVVRAQVLNKTKEFGGNAYKVLGFAYKPFTKGQDCEKNLIFTGLIAFQDPPREEVKGAIAKFKNAGIKIVMITGDHKSTAVAIAKKVGIIQSESEVLTGTQLSKMSGFDLAKKIENYSVFARVSPQDKVRVVKTFKSIGKVVAMTGDGVNDAPSLKEANIGIGMGITGTEVAQNASDLILADDNISTIVRSVEEGRKVYDNITKTIGFLLSANIAEMLSLLLITLFVSPFNAGLVFLIPAQILFVNLVTDALPAIALGVEPSEKNTMNRKPTSNNRHLLSGRVGINIIYQGIIQTAIIIFVFIFGLYKFGNQAGSTMALITLNFIQLFHCYNLKSEDQSLFKIGLKNNKVLNLSFIIGLALTVAVCTIKPFMRAFGVCKLNFECWAVSILSAFLIIPIVEIVKFFQRKATIDKK